MDDIDTTPDEAAARASQLVDAAKEFLATTRDLQTLAAQFETATIHFRDAAHAFCSGSSKLRDAEREVSQAATALQDAEREAVQAAMVLRDAEQEVDQAAGEELLQARTKRDVALERLNVAVMRRHPALQNHNAASEKHNAASNEKKAAERLCDDTEGIVSQIKERFHDAVAKVLAAVPGCVDHPVHSYREVVILEEINKDENSLYKRALEDWQHKQKDLAIKVSRRENKSVDLTNQIFNIIGWYAVFQGVVLTAVSQLAASNQPGSLPMCKKIWSPIVLTAFSTLVTSGGILYKFRGLEGLEVTILSEKQAREELESRVSNLRREGPRGFRFHKHTKNSLPLRKPRPFWVNCIPVIVSLFIFTFLFIASFLAILCNTWSTK